MVYRMFTSEGLECEVVREIGPRLYGPYAGQSRCIIKILQASENGIYKVGETFATLNRYLEG